MNPGRRAFIKAGAAAGAGLTLAFYLPPAFGQTAAPGKTAGAAAPFAPNAFVRIGADNSVTVIVKHLEMGQGVYTGLPTLVAEELDADWAQIKVEGAPANAKLYNNLAWGPVQGTGASTSIANSFEQLRKAGAAARDASCRRSRSLGNSTRRDCSPQGRGDGKGPQGDVRRTRG